MSGELDDFLDRFEQELRPYLSSERRRVTTERDFLLAVLRGRSDGVTVEDASTELTVTYLSGYLSDLIPVQDDEESG